MELYIPGDVLAGGLKSAQIFSNLFDGHCEDVGGQQGISAADGRLRPHDRGDPLYPGLLQLYVWQEYDLAPEFPTLKGFLTYWQRELECALHSVRVAHHRLINPSEWRVVDGVFTIQ